MFVRYPEKGKVKSRLSRYWDEEMVVCLYRAFIEDLLVRLARDDFNFRIAYHPREKAMDFPKEFGDGYSYLPQVGSNLGERMLDCFRRCFADGFRLVVIIGSDSPDLPPRIINEAFQALEKGGAVIGPAYDGGYYLIGFGRESFIPEAFVGIAWGTDRVGKTTMDILEKAGIDIHVLPPWRDIDRPEDILDLIKNSRDTDFAESKTIACLRDYGITGHC